MPESENNTAIDACLALAEDARRLGQRIIEDTREDITAIAEDQDRHESIFQDVSEYNENFEKFRQAFDALTNERKLETADAARQAALVRALEQLADCNKDMSEIIENIKSHTGKRLGVLGNARGIFEKFVKMPEGPPPRFYDKKG